MAVGLKNGDIEAGNGHLYPSMVEDPQFRWAFIRKVYSIVAFQFILTATVANTVVFVRPVAEFMVSSKLGFAIYIVVLVSPIIILCPLFAYQDRHPINFILLVSFYACDFLFNWHELCFYQREDSFGSSDFDSRRGSKPDIIHILGSKRGQDFSFLGRFLFAGLMVLMAFMLIQLFVPIGKMSVMIWGCIAAIIFSGYIVHDTDNLIKRYSYNEHIPAAISLYLDIVNLFLAILAILTGSDN